MGFGEAIASGWSNWNNFQGRARRSAYWFWHLFIWLSVIAIIFVGAIANIVAGGHAFSRVAAFAVIAFFVAICIPSLALTVRRMHDLGLTGWIVLVSFIPYLGSLIIFILSVLPGTRGTNRYGPDSRDKTNAADVFA